MATTRRPAVKKATRKPATKKRVAAGTIAKATATAGKAKRPAAARKGAIGRASGEALRLAGIGTDAVARATGKAWDQWLSILDKAGAVAMPHKAIAAMLAEKYGLPPWWNQMVAVGYEQARGLREAFQQGDWFAANASRTLNASVERLYGAWADPALRSLWLGNAPAEVTRSTDGKSMRIAWTAGGQRVDVNFSPAGAGKSRVQVEHGRLKDAKAVAEKKAFWKGALERLKSLLEKAA
jgi:uncharacterized protein YndB with AHSA1/START domain